MAISDNQKIDYLFKKLGFGATKTDTIFNKLAANESLPSPLLIRGDTIWAESGQIPTVRPSASNSYLTIQTAIEAVEDITATGNRTWRTGITDWIPTEFGSTYLVNVYIHDSNDAAGAESLINKVFTTGSGNNDEWFFDYQSGVLNFIGENLPNGKDFSGKSVYISGATYSGSRGVASASITADITNLQSQVDSIISNTDPAVLDSLTEIVTAFEGADANFATSSELTTLESTLRSDLALPVSTIQPAETFTGDGSQSSFTLNNAPASAEAIDIYVDDVLQRPEIFTLNGTTLTFSVVPHINADIYVKYRYSFANITAFPDNAIKANHITNGVIQSQHLNLIYNSHQHDGDGGTRVYTINTGHTIHDVLVIVNGLILPPQDYTIVGTTLTLFSPPAQDAKVDIRYLPV